jgi:hypothetical protein
MPRKRLSPCWRERKKREEEEKEREEKERAEKEKQKQKDEDEEEEEEKKTVVKEVEVKVKVKEEVIEEEEMEEEGLNGAKVKEEVEEEEMEEGEVKEEKMDKMEGTEETEREKNDSKNNTLTQPPQGPVTDYGATFVHWMRHRRPRYKGSFAGETERPSNSYIVDVSLSSCLLETATNSVPDAASPCEDHKPSRLGALAPPALISQQDQAPNQRGAVDARGQKAVDGLQQRRVYPLERHRLQL